jgi:predicted DNA-binding antitoxin AbrB/MazE fold protein
VRRNEGGIQSGKIELEDKDAGPTTPRFLKECFMIQIMDAIYEDGVLKLHGPLNLPAHSQVRVSIEIPETPSTSVPVIERLRELWKNASVASNEPRLTRDELHERR